MAFIAVNTSSMKAEQIRARLYYRKMNWDMTLLYDSDNAMVEAFNMQVLPVTIIVSPGSNVHYFHNKRSSKEEYLRLMDEKLGEVLIN